MKSSYIENALRQFIGSFVMKTPFDSLTCFCLHDQSFMNSLDRFFTSNEKQPETHPSIE